MSNSEFSDEWRAQLGRIDSIRKNQKTDTFDPNAPHSDEAECSVLGSLLYDSTAWDRVADLLRPEDFFWPVHAEVFKAAGQLYEESQPVDIITVYERLSSNKDFQAAGGLVYLNEIVQSVYSTVNVRAHAEIVRDRSARRQLINASREIIATATVDNATPTNQLIDTAEASIFAIAESRQKSKQGFVGAGEVLTQVIDDLTARAESGNTSMVTGMPTGFIDLDERTTGLNAGDLVILAARPAMGKTSFAMNIAENVALTKGLPVAVFSLEMPAKQLMQRMTCSNARIDQQKFRTGRLEDSDWTRVSEAIERLGRCSIHIDETPAISPLEVRARCRRLARQHGDLGLVVIDYLQLMQSHVKSDNRAHEVSEITKSLKGLAKELKCPVVALSQLNRGVEQRPNKRPVMSDLRESGGIEQDADIIMFIYRDEVYNPDTKDTGIAEIIIGKQRNGPIGTTRLAFMNSHTRFENLAPGFYSDPDGPPPSKGSSGGKFGSKGGGKHSSHDDDDVPYSPGF